ncbi:inositol monophosphatase family protein [Actinoplanes sp. NPDC051494]|uniref:inositol monophosphatase family protein n=1 Tax=Actinoplanes sp. NPDC051494 TaxID=3363907 RepID=UPI0037B4FA4B
MRNDTDLAIAAAEAGAAVVLGAFGDRLDRVDKGAGDFATAADIAAEQAILGLLRTERPDDDVVGEESGLTGDGRQGRRWLVDPLCGTLNYATGGMAVAVNVALRSGRETVVAAVADPFSGELFWSDDTGAWVRRDGRDEKLTPSPESRLVDVNLDPPFPNAPSFRAAELLADPRFGAQFRPRVISTTLAVAWVAAGRRAAYVTDGRLEESVHFAAGIALCQAAGCVVTDLQGQPMHTGSGGLVVAADRATHEVLLGIVG